MPAESPIQVKDIRDAMLVMFTPTPDISALTSPWPSPDITDDAEVIAAQDRFKFQRARYLHHLQDVGEAMEYVAAWVRRIRGRNPRRIAAQRAIRIHRAAVLARDGFLCGICGGDIVKNDLSIDHLLPISLGGTDGLDNLQPAHKICNSRKRNRTDLNLRLGET